MSRTIPTFPPNPSSTLAPEQWVDVYGDQMFRYAAKILRDQDAAEEVVQDALLTGVRNQEQFQGKGTQIAWLMKILRNKALDYLRKRQEVSARIQDEFDPTSEVFDSEGNWQGQFFPSKAELDTIDRQELWDIVQACLGKLPNRTAEAFVLRVVDSLKLNDIARALEISPANVSVRLHRARLSLARCVGAKWDDRPANLRP